jgi:hypothetical protein
MREAARPPSLRSTLMTDRVGELSAQCIEAARGLVAGRAVLLGGGQLAACARRVRTLHELGAARCFIVATGTGTGPLPEPAHADWIVVDVEAPDMMTEMRIIESIVSDPPADVVAALEAFDPERDALVLLASVGSSSKLGDREGYGARPASWVALEDKTVGDALFDCAGVPRPPSHVVAASFAALGEAAAELDRGAGTVWAGDAREGFNGGGAYVRWVHGGDDGRGAAAFFAEHCDRVRVAPFADGLSCSVHGFVTDDGVAVFRPVELVNLRRPAGDRLQYAGCATFWDPAPSDREEMRAAARRLGEHLRATVAYRGWFTLDGIMGADGFVATECNPRPGAGSGYVAAALPDVPFDMVQYRAVAGEAEWLQAAEMEAVVLEAGDRLRWGGGWTPVTTRFAATSTEPLLRDGQGFRAASADEEADATLTLGPGAAGGFMRVEFNPSRTPVGASVGPLIVDAFAYADATHGTGIGSVTAATPVR